MATLLTFNGTQYSIPANREPKGWGTSLSSFLVDVGNNALSKSGGTFTLTTEIDFGGTAGLKALYYKSRGATVASAGIVRLANTEAISWRDNGDTADLDLTANASDRLTYGGVVIPTLSSSDTFTNKTHTSPVLNGTISGDAFLDEDDLVSDSATKVASQQSIKAYVDTQIAGASGDVSGPGSATDNAVARFDSTTGKLIQNSGVTVNDSNDVSGVNALSVAASISVGVSVATSGVIKLGNAAAIRWRNNADSANLSLTANSSDLLTYEGVVIPTISSTSTFTNKTHTSPVFNGTISGDAFLDEDDMVSDSDTKLASQQSIKAYVDTQVAASGATQYQAKSGDYPITDSDNARTIGVTNGASDYTVTLPTVADNTHRIITVKKVDSGSGKVTLTGEGAETIDGVASIDIFKQGHYITVQSTGTAWEIIDRKTPISFRVSSTTSQSIGGTATLVTTMTSSANAEDYDDAAMFDSATNDRADIPQGYDGVWSVWAFGNGSNLPDQAYLAIDCYVTGVASNKLVWSFVSVSGTQDGRVEYTDRLRLTSSDYVDVRMRVLGTTAKNCSGSFSMVYEGP